MGRPAWILVAGQFVSVVGDGLASVAVLWWVLRVTGSVALMATVAAMQALGGLVASPFAGVWVDRLDRRRLMMAGSGLAGGTR
jgi:DHA3 family macrolide efflux protein-like MFS transporter